MTWQCRPASDSQRQLIYDRIQQVNHKYYHPHESKWTEMREIICQMNMGQASEVIKHLTHLKIMGQSIEDEAFIELLETTLNKK